MKEIQRLLSFARRAIDDYGMIEDGDHIAVGISGGKDSLSLLQTLSELRRFYPKKFTLTAITVDMGFPTADFDKIKNFSDDLGVPYHIVKTDIANIIFNIRKEPNPCSLCSKMRRGALHQAATSLGCNRVALGHHFDDVVETFMLNLMFEGRLGSFSPVTYLSNSNLYLIRPLIYAQEKDVQYFTRHANLPIMESPCPEDHNTERENVKLLLRRMEEENKGLRHRIFGALCRAELDGYKDVRRISEQFNRQKDS